jgi:hypothetical protein
MRRYLIMLSALFVAIIVMTLIKSWQRRRAIARGEDPEAIKGITIAHLIGAFAGLVVFFLSVCLLEGTSSAPGTAYRPAVITDGQISSGGFEEGGQSDGVQSDGVQSDGVQSDGVQSDGVQSDGNKGDGG